jgi:septal ring factor EnvC (AmiA/AmiB activator)
MANRSSSPRRADVSGPPRKPGLKGRAYIAVAALVCLVSIVASAQGPVEQAASPDAAAKQAEALARRAADRIAALQREAESLAGQERTLLGELRKLEIDRQIRMERLNGIEREAAGVRSKLADATTRATALAGQAEQQRPDIEARLVRLYKLGRAGYWRMLLDVTSLREMGRAYRTAAALGRIDRDRVEEHRRTLSALEAERTTLQARARQLDKLETEARRASDAVEVAVAARAALVRQIDERRDLNAQLAGELQDAHRRLQTTVAQMAAGREVPPASLPLRPFRGALPWPAEGVLSSRFGTIGRGGPASSRNGIEISLPEGQMVHAVHEGVVAYADPFSGYGYLVIVDHGDRAYSLYGHLSAVSVKKGDRVDGATPVGLAGRNPSGNPSLYFELRVDGGAVDPLQWLKRQ